MHAWSLPPSRLWRQWGWPLMQVTFQSYAMSVSCGMPGHLHLQLWETRRLTTCVGHIPTLHTGTPLCQLYIIHSIGGRSFLENMWLLRTQSAPGTCTDSGYKLYSDTSRIRAWDFMAYTVNSWMRVMDSSIKPSIIYVLYNHRALKCTVRLPTYIYASL